MTEDNKKPPYSSTGAMNTWGKSLTACVDWFEATFFECQDYKNVIGVLTLNPGDFTLFNVGQWGYQQSAKCGNITILFDGSSDADMGVHLIMSGQGCREYEQTFEQNGWNWSQFCQYLLGYKTKITRLDLAIDDFEGYFKLSQVKACIKQGCVVSPFDRGRSFEEYVLNTGDLVGQTIYFGKSDVMVRFYDKYQERINHGYVIDQDIDFWQRTELQIRHERAHEACQIMAYWPDDLGKFICGVLKRYLKFKIKGNDSNRSRWKDKKWWLVFLGDVDKICLTQIAPEKSILRTKDWIDSSVVASMAMLQEAFGDDDLLYEYVIKLGKTKMSDVQKDLADDFRCNLTKRMAIKSEMRQVIKQLDFDNRDINYKKIISKPGELTNDSDQC